MPVVGRFDQAQALPRARLPDIGNTGLRAVRGEGLDLPLMSAIREGSPQVGYTGLNSMQPSRIHPDVHWILTRRPL